MEAGARAMTGQVYRLVSLAQRDRVKRLAESAPHGVVVEFREPKRTDDQNAKLWAMLTDVARAKPQGRVMTTEAWKALFMHAAGFQCTFEPSLDGRGVVPMGFKSSRLNKVEFSDLIEAVYAYGSEHGVEWSEPRASDEHRNGEDARSVAEGRSPASAVAKRRAQGGYA